MTEIRAVRSDELDCMLEIMCEGFSLPYTPARDLFYRDPYFNIDRKRVLVHAGEIISCMTIIDSPIWLGKACIPAAGIAGVATRKQSRHRGWAEKLLTGSFPYISKSGYGLCALFPFDYEYYKKLGWQRSSSINQIKIAPASLPDFSESRKVRPMNRSDLQEAHQVYLERSQFEAGRRIRDSKRWNYIFDHVKQKMIFKTERIEGYILFEPRENDGKHVLRLMEFMAISENARRGLTGYLAQQKQYAEIQYSASQKDLSSSIMLYGGTDYSNMHPPSIDVMPGVMTRITNIVTLLEQMKPNFQGFCGALAVSVTDNKLEDSIPRSALIEGNGSAIFIHPILEENDIRDKIVGDVRVMSQLICGYIGLADGISTNSIHASTEKAASLALPLFPRRDFFIPTADYF
jgi:predicted acetyltransferase